MQAQQQLFIKSVNGRQWYLGLEPTHPGAGRCSELGSYFHAFSIHADNREAALRLAKAISGNITICDVLRLDD